MRGFRLSPRNSWDFPPLVRCAARVGLIQTFQARYRSPCWKSPCPRRQLAILCCSLLTGQPPLGHWCMGFALQWQRFGFRLGGAAFTAPYKPTEICTALCRVYRGPPAVQACTANYSFTPYASVNGTWLLERPYAWPPPSWSLLRFLRVVSVRLCVYLDCDHCGWFLLAARNLECPLCLSVLHAASYSAVPMGDRLPQTPKRDRPMLQ